MAEDSEKQDAPKLPPKLNLRKQGVLKQPPEAKDNPTKEAEVEAPSKAAPRQSTSRLVVKPAAQKPAEDAAAKSEPSPIMAATEAAEEAAEKAIPAIKLKPLQPKPASKPASEPVSKPAPETAPAAPTADAAPAQTDTKRKTSRIPLESAKAAKATASDDGTVAPLKPKTIKIKPNAPIPQIRATQKLNLTVPIIENESDTVTTDAEKRKTSRIPLEEALTADKESAEPAEPADPTRPKTIKIKRPGSEAATIKAKTPTPTPTMDDNEMSKTARLDHLPLDDNETTPTQKKTIRVKRPEGAATAAPARPGLGLTPPEPIEEPDTDEPGVVCALMALAATLLLCVVIYMLAAQAFGPNLSGTKLSSWTGGPNLSWPGKILN